MQWFDAHLDNNLIATYVKSSTPSEIKVYNTEAELVTIIPLSNESSNIESLDINNGRVYYAERDMAISRMNRLQTVFEFDIKTGMKRSLYTTPAFNEHITRIAADKDHIVMRGGDDMNKILLHTLSDGETKPIITSRNYINDLAIYGDHVVWGCDRMDGNQGREIHVYTISTGIDSVIPESVSIKTTGSCDISGDLVVWGKAAGEMNYINGVPVWGPSSGGQIQVTNLSTGKTISLEQFDGYPDPFIFGDYVFFNTVPASNNDNNYENQDIGLIRTYNIKTGDYSELASGAGTIKDAAANRVIWSKFRPVSFWLTTVPGENLPIVSPVVTHEETETQVSLQQNPTPAQESPVDPVTIVSALAVGLASCALLKKRD